MTFQEITKVPSFEQIKKNIPISEKLKEEIQKHREEIQNILSGKDKRKILIIGPCSAWPNDAVLKYVNELVEINNQVKDNIKIIIRTYTQKPRTTIGWTGPLTHPEPNLEPNLIEGIKYCREMMIEIVKKGFAVCDESLFISNSNYFEDILSWIAIGARSSENSEHRFYASLIDIPVGMKNPTSGDIDIGINSVISSQANHNFIYQNKLVKSSGNEFSHLILRGGNKKGSNVKFEDLKYACEKINNMPIKNKSIICDASHDNTLDETHGKKNHLLQSEVVFDIIESMKKNILIKKTIKGFMVESFIKSGNQNISEEMDLEGLSITDPCLGLEESIELIKELNKKLKTL